MSPPGALGALMPLAVGWGCLVSVLPFIFPHTAGLAGRVLLRLTQGFVPGLVLRRKTSFLFIYLLFKKIFFYLTERE